MITRRQLFQGLGAATAGGVGFGGLRLPSRSAPASRAIGCRRRAGPAGLNVKFAVIADLHACKPWMDVERIEGIVAQVNALRPDCVLLLGDYVAGHKIARYSEPVAHKDWAGALGRPRAPLGVHAVLGNHDWWEEDAVQRAPLRARPRQGWRCRTPASPCTRTLASGWSRMATRSGSPAWVTSGPTGRHPWKRLWRLYEGVDDLAGTLARVTDDAPVVLMAHEPDIFPLVPDRVALTVAGHTHGGQVRVLGYAPIVPSKYGARYVYGHVVEQGRNLIVSGGLGCSGLPVRFGSPPEIVLIELGVSRSRRVTTPLRLVLFAP